MLSSEILEIYEKIPRSKCKEGCSKCCTNVIQFSPSELAHMGSYANDGCCSHCVDGANALSMRKGPLSAAFMGRASCLYVRTASRRDI